ncbi:hypothetical protein [Rhodococcus koreensis]
MSTIQITRPDLEYIQDSLDFDADIRDDYPTPAGPCIAVHTTSLAAVTQFVTAMLTYSEMNRTGCDEWAVQLPELWQEVLTILDGVVTSTDVSGRTIYFWPQIQVVADDAMADDDEAETEAILAGIERNGI